MHRLLLDRPSAPGASGKPYPLTGRAVLASGTAVAIESNSGDGWHHVADATVVLQLYLKERFGWWPVATHRLDKRSRTTFRPAQRGVRARVVLTLPNGHDARDKRRPEARARAAGNGACAADADAPLSCAADALAVGVSL